MSLYQETLERHAIVYGNGIEGFNESSHEILYEMIDNILYFVEDSLSTVEKFNELKQRIDNEFDNLGETPFDPKKGVNFISECMDLLLVYINELDCRGCKSILRDYLWIMVNIRGKITQLIDRLENGEIGFSGEENKQDINEKI